MINQIENVIESLVYEENNKLYARIVYDKNNYNNKTEDEIYICFMEQIEKLNEKLPQFKKINNIIVTTDELEKNNLGKIKRNLELARTHKENFLKESKDNEDEIFVKINNILSNQLGNKEISIESEFAKDLCADSLDMVEIFLMIEKEFGIKITKEQRKEISKVKDVIELIK